MRGVAALLTMRVERPHPEGHRETMRLEGLDGFPIQFSNSHGPSFFRVIASASEAIHRAAQKEWIASSLSLLAMTANRDTPAHSRDALAPGSCKKSCAPKEQRAQGMVLTASFALFPVTGLSCHRR